MYSGSADGTVRIWPVRDDATAPIPFGDGYRGSVDLAFSPDGRRIAVYGDHRVVQWRDASTGALLAPALDVSDDAPIGHLGFDPLRGGLYIVTNRGIAFRDTGSTAWIRPAFLNGLAGDMRPAALSPDGTLLASWDAALDALQMWDASTGESLGPSWEAADSTMGGLTFSADGGRLLSYNDDGSARLWDSRTGRALGEPLRGHEDRVIHAVFSATGERIVTAGADGTIRLWDGRTGRALGLPWRGHAGPVTRVAFTPDGSRVLSGGKDGSVRLWDVVSGLQLGEAWQGSAGGTEVTGIAIRPDGLSAATADGDGTLRLWPMPAAAAATACGVLTRNMSVRRWHDWVSRRLEYRCQCGALPVAPDDPAAPTPPLRCEARFAKDTAP